MSTTKYTPGPWRAVKEKAVPVFQKQHYAIYSANAQTLLRSDYLTEADAKLIAAAPDLLHACQAIIDYENRGRAKGEPRIPEEWYNQLNDAIKKATAN